MIGQEVTSIQFFYTESAEAVLSASPPLPNNNSGISLSISNSSVSILYQNVRGLRSKVITFSEFVLTSTYDVYSITESWLDGSIDDCELFGSGYVVYRADRNRAVSGRQDGGGVVLAVKTAFRSEPLFFSFNLVESVWAKVFLTNNLYVIMGSVYVPPYCQAEAYRHFYSELGEAMLSNPCQWLVLGDFNIPSLATTDAHDRFYLDFQNFLNFSDLCQRNCVRNANNRILDVVVCNAAADLKVVNCLDPPVRPDTHHPPLEIVYHFHAPLVDNADVRSPGERFCFKRGNYDLLYRLLSDADYSSVLAEPEPEAALSVFYEIINLAMTESIPKMNVQPMKGNFPYWVPNWLRKAISNKHKLMKRIRRLDPTLVHTELLLVEYCELSKRIKKLWRRCKRRHMREVEHQVNSDPKLLYKYVNSFKAKANPEFMVDDAGLIVKGDNNIANAFAHYFQQVVTESFVPNLPFPIDSTMSGVRPLPVTQRIVLSEILSAAKRLKPKPSCGTDGIPSYIVKACIEPICLPLLHILNLCLAFGCFPSKWKEGKIIVLHKKGNVNSFSNYRSITLLNSLAKLFELILSTRIQSDFIAHVTPYQHGFLPGRSTCTNLIEFTQRTADELNAGGQMDCLYLDFKKAFQSVQAALIIQKLSVLLNPLLLRLVRDYLMGRVQFISYKGKSSFTFEALCGVPEGSILGPLLFIVFINDLPLSVNFSLALMYADDVKLMARVTNRAEAELLQNDLDALCQWASNNHIYFNTSKCHIMSFSRRLVPFQYAYIMDGATLARINEVKDLGLTFVSNLSFNKHIDIMISQSYKALGFLIRMSRGFSNSTTMNLYKSLVRSRLEYSVLVWCPHSMVYASLIERVQKRFLRVLYFRAHGAYPHFINNPVSTAQLQLEFEICDLGRRRTLLQVIFLRNIIGGKVDFEFGLSRVSFNAVQLGRRQRSLFRIGQSRTIFYSNSPLPRLMTLVESYADQIDIFNDSLAQIKLAVTGS